MQAIDKKWYIHIEYADKEKNTFIGYFDKRWKATKRLKDEVSKIDPTDLVISVEVKEYVENL